MQQLSHYWVSLQEEHTVVRPYVMSISRKYLANYLDTVLIKAAPPSNEYLGMVSDRSLLEWFTLNAQKTSTLAAYLSTPLSKLNLPSLYLYAAVVAAKASDTVLDAMRLMSDEGVSSVAVLQEEGGGLLSAVSVTDVGKVSSDSLRALE